MAKQRATSSTAVSNLLYCILVVAVGAAVASRAPDLDAVQAHFQTASLWAAGLACATLLALTVHHLARRPRAVPL